MSALQMLRHGPIGLSGLFREFDDLMQEGSRAMRTHAAVKEYEDRYKLYLDVPGVDSNDLDVEIEKGVLTIKGERKDFDEQDKGTWTFAEQSFGQFSRQFRLPDSINSDAIKADFKNGVLILDLPKEEKATPKRIKIGDDAVIKSIKE